MVAAADELKGELGALGGDGVSVALTGSSGMWSDFNEANKSAMLKSELLLAGDARDLVLAFGSLVAAGLPLLLTILGLVASADLLFLLAGFEISIWAMNFALMFALALGVDYALFVVHRFRGAYFGSALPVRDAVAVTMDTAGKAVLFSGLTVLISLGSGARSEPRLPLDGAGDHALGRLRPAGDADAAAGGARQARPRVDALARWVHSASTARPASRAGASGSGAALISTGARRAARRSLPVLGLRTGMPSIKVVPEDDGSRVGYAQVQQAFPAPARGRCSSSRPGATHRRSPGSQRPTPGSLASRRRRRAETGSPLSRRSRESTRRARRSASRSTDCARRFRLVCSSPAAPLPRTTTSSRHWRQGRRS